jgi:hypothetical protein
MARLRIILEDDDGREINGDTERRSDLSGGTRRLVEIEAAVEALKQAALPELTAALLPLAPHQFVAAGKKGASCDVMGRGASRASPCTGPLRSWSSGSSAPAVGKPPPWSGPSNAVRAP